MKKLIPLSIGLIILLPLLCTSWASDNDSPASAQPAASKPARIATTPPPAPTKRTIVDLSGRTVIIPAVVNRVATSFPATNQMIYMLGAGDKIVATVTSIAKNDIFVKIYPRLAKISTPFEGAEINIESLILAKPDVCFRLPTTDAAIKSIEQAGIPVIITPGFTDAATLKDGLRLIAKVLGPKEEEVAKSFCVYYDNNIQKIGSVTSSIPKKQRPKLYYSANNPLNTEGKGTLPQFWAEMAGAVNVAAEAGIEGSFKNISAEDLVKWNPDVIVVRDFVNKGAILKDSRFSNISAVRNNRVYVNPKGIFVWCARSAEEALQILWTAKILYPEKFPGLDIRQETKNFYKQFYHYTMSEEDLKETLEPGR